MWHFRKRSRAVRQRNRGRRAGPPPYAVVVMRATGDSPVTGSPDSGVNTGTRTDRPTSPRVASLTGLRALAALLIVATHAAYRHRPPRSDGYLPAQVYARLEVGVRSSSCSRATCCSGPGCWLPSSGTPGSLGAPLCRAAGCAVSLRPYVITVLIAFAIYQFRDAGPNPGHSWLGIVETPDAHPDLSAGATSR